MPLKARLLRREVLPFVASFALLAVLALALDGLLHLLDLLWVGRWLGIPGTLLIIGSTAYSLRKRKLIHSGHPAKLLRWHELLAWLGSLLVLVHAGVHFNAILGYVSKLNELDTEGVRPTSHPVPVRQRLRDDEVEPFPARDLIMAAAPQREGEYYRVPRVID